MLIRDGARPADAFSHVLAGHLQMHTAGISAFGRMDGKEALYFREDAVEGTRLVAGGRGDGVAVHRIARPYHDATLAVHGADQLRQVIGDLVSAKAGDQRQPSRLVVRIEDVNQLEQFIRLEREPAFQPDRVPDAAEIFDMGVVELARAVPDPDEMA